MAGRPVASRPDKPRQPLGAAAATLKKYAAVVLPCHRVAGVSARFLSCRCSILMEQPEPGSPPSCMDQCPGSREAQHSHFRSCSPQVSLSQCHRRSLLVRIRSPGPRLAQRCAPEQHTHCGKLHNLCPTSVSAVAGAAPGDGHISGPRLALCAIPGHSAAGVCRRGAAAGAAWLDRAQRWALRTDAAWLARICCSPPEVNSLVPASCELLDFCQLVDAGF